MANTNTGSGQQQENAAAAAPSAPSSSAVAASPPPPAPVVAAAAMSGARARPNLAAIFAAAAPALADRANDQGEEGMFRSDSFFCLHAWITGLRSRLASLFGCGCSTTRLQRLGEVCL